jgi:hypothetical protein
MGSAALVVCMAVEGMVGSARAANEAGTTWGDILKLTGGKRAKVVWNEGAGESRILDYFDTNVGRIVKLPFAGNAPKFTPDGTRVLATVGDAVMMYHTETGNVTELYKGPHRSLMTVWQDPKTGKEWVYVNDKGEKGARYITLMAPDSPQARAWFGRFDKDFTKIEAWVGVSAENGPKALHSHSWVEK